MPWLATVATVGIILFDRKRGEKKLYAKTSHQQMILVINEKLRYEQLRNLIIWELYNNNRCK